MKQYIEPPREATTEEIFTWAKQVCEILNREDNESGNENTQRGR